MTPASFLCSFCHQPLHPQSANTTRNTPMDLITLTHRQGPPYQLLQNMVDDADHPTSTTRYECCFACWSTKVVPYLDTLLPGCEIAVAR